MDWTTVLPVGTFALALSFASGPLLAVGDQMSEWNTDNDVALSSDEFRSGFEQNGAFDSWDANDDSMLDENELNEGLGDDQTTFIERFGDDYYDQWDTDDDNMLSEDEFYIGTYDAYDDNDDNVIDEPEFGDLGDDIGDGGIFDV